MIEIHKQKLMTGIAACAVVLAVAAFAQRSESISGLFAPTVPAKESAAVAAPSKESKAIGAAHHTDAPQATIATGKVDINTADLNLLQTLHGIGEVKARAIIEYRRAHGLFYRIEDIVKVRGVGPVMFERMKNDITVGAISPLEEVSASNISTSISPSTSPKISRAAHVIITAVITGMKDNAAYK